MIFILLTPLIICALIACLYRANEREMERYRRETSEPYIKAAKANLQWHRNDYLIKK